MEVARPVATVLSHLSEEVPYKPNAYVYKYIKFFGKKQGKFNSSQKSYYITPVNPKEQL